MRRRWTRGTGAALLFSAACWYLHAPQPASLQRISGTVIPQIGQAGGIRAFAIAPDGKTVATLGETIKFWDIENGVLLRTLSLSETPWQPRNLRLSPDGTSLAFLDDTPDGTRLRLLNVASGRLCPLKTPTGYYRDFAFLKNDKVSLNVNGQLRTYDTRTGSVLRQSELPSAYPWGAVAENVALMGNGKYWSLCNLQTGKVQKLQRSLNLQAADFSADGRTLVTGQNRFPAPLAMTRDRITFSILGIDEKVPQIRRAVRAVAEPLKTPDGTIALWDGRNGRLRRVITAFPAQVGAFRSVALSQQGHFVAAYGSQTYKTGYRSSVKVWECTTGRLKGEWPLKDDGFLTTHLSVSDMGTVGVVGLKTDNSGIAAAPHVWNSRTRIWHSSNGGSLTDKWRHLEWSPDGALLAGGSVIGSATQGLWPGGSYYYSAYSLSGAMPTFFFSGGTGFYAETIRLWDLKNGAMRSGFWGPVVPPRSTAGQGVTALQQGGLASVLGVCAFSPSSQMLATDEGGTIALRDVKTGGVVRTLAALPLSMTNVGDWSQFLWSPQGDSLVALTKLTTSPSNVSETAPGSGVTATLTLWNIQTGRLKAVFVTKARSIKAAYSADGRAIVALVDGTPRGWQSNGAPLNVAALPALPRGTRELCSRLLTRQGHIMRVLRKGKMVFLETREILTGKVARYDFPPPFGSKSFAPRQIFVAPDGSSVAVQQANGALALWNLGEWKLLGHIEAPQNPVVAPAPGGRLIAVARAEGAIQIYDPAVSSIPLNLQVLPSLQPRRGGQEWAVYMTNGFYNASPQAPRQLRGLKDGKTFPLPS